MMNHINKMLAQQIVEAVKEVCGKNINFIDGNGNIYASTDERRIGRFHQIGYRAVCSKSAIEVTEDNSHSGIQKGINIPIIYHGMFVAVIGITGDPKEVRKYAQLAVRITELIIREHEHNSRYRSELEKNQYIIQSLIFGETTNREYLSTCILELGIPESELCHVMIVRFHERDQVINKLSLEQRLFDSFKAANAILYTFHYPNEYIVLITHEAFEKHRAVYEMLLKDTEYAIKIGIGSSEPFDQLARSYETCRIAMKGSDNDLNRIADFNHLNLEMLFYSVRPDVKESYLNKILSALSKADKELLNIYYDHQMSLSGTCQVMYLHKNSLQYKLDRISHLCGYNPRKFKDAVILYCALKMEQESGSFQ